MLIIAYNKASYWFKNYNYGKKVNKFAEYVKNELERKEIFMIYVRVLAEYLDPKIYFYKPEYTTTPVFFLDQ